MRRAFRYSIAPVLLGLLATSQANARGGWGGGVGGGFHGEFHGGFRAENFARHRGFVRHQPLFAHPFANRQFVTNGVNNGLNGTDIFSGWWSTGARWNSGLGRGSAGWSGWGWPGGDWAGGYGSTGGYYGYANPPVQQAPSQPQIVVINTNGQTDGQGRMQTAEAPADYSYVKGCHAIPNGYHCDAP